MPTVVALLVAALLVAVSELVRFGVARLLRLPTSRIARVFLDVQGGPRWARPLPMLAGSLASYAVVASVAVVFFAVEGVATDYDEVRVVEVPSGYPATGKLRKGDRIIAVDGEPLKGSLNLAIDRRNGAPVRLTIVRESTTQDITLQPIPHDGHWVVGVRPAVAPARSYEPGLAVARGLAFPITQALDLIPASEFEAELGGPVQVTEVYDKYTGPPGPLVLALVMFYGVYLLLLIVATDLVRGVRAVARR